MEWVAKRYFFGGALLVIALATSTLLLIVQESPASPSYCLDPSTSTLRVTTDELCPAPLKPLGSAPLEIQRDSRGRVIELNPFLQTRFQAARAAAASDGESLHISSGFRSEKNQSKLFSEAIRKYGSESEASKWVLPAKSSHHPDGLAIDVNLPGNKKGALWLEENGARFGLCRVYANEWWHFEGVIAPGGICPPMAANAQIDLK